MRPGFKLITCPGCGEMVDKRWHVCGSQLPYVNEVAERERQERIYKEKVAAFRYRKRVLKGTKGWLQPKRERKMNARDG